GGAGLTTHHVVVVVAVVAGFVALAVWWVASSRPSAVEPVSGIESPAGAASPATTPPEPPEATGDPASESSGKVVVDVTGKVRRPGIVSLRAGSRVADAIEAAGGPRRRG